jgi:signal transduction histidine kinase/ActR/RegA family two-component response regulator
VDGSDRAALDWVLERVESPEEFAERVEYLWRHEHEVSRDELRLRDGRIFDRYSAPVTGADEHYYGRIWFFRDISDRKRGEEALRQAKEEAEGAREAAESANRAKSEFLSRMSHELRTPMNSILGFAQLLAKRDLPHDQRKAVDHILKAGEHLLNLINEVLDIARIEANRQQLSLEPVRVRYALHEALSLIRPLAAQRHTHVPEDVEVDGDPYVRADRQRLAQVLLNLLSNAVKYNRPGGAVWLSCRRVRDAASAEERLRIGVHDTGAGIAADKLDELFVPFARLGAEQTEVEGTGLGLALSKRLVEAMGGRISVESTPDAGSVFFVELQVVPAPLEGLGRAAATLGAGEQPPGGPATILYIEDNLANLALVEAILANRPVKLMPALQGQLGIDLAAEHQPDVVLLDLHLPDMRGDEVLRRLQADPRTRDIPVVVISADATDSSVERLLDAGARAYISKPLDVDEFLTALDSVLRETVPEAG